MGTSPGGVKLKCPFIKKAVQPIAGAGQHSLKSQKIA